MLRSLSLLLSVVLVFGLLVGGSVEVQAQEDSITVMSVWGGQELDAFKKVAASFEAATGIEVKHESTRDLPTLLTTRLEAGNPPDIVHLTGMGMMKDHAEDGNLVDLKNVFDVNEFRKEYDEKWIDLAEYEDGMYGLFISADVKSLVWYNPKEFEKKGYEIPETWDELKELTDTMIENGDTPWAIGLESGEASGWPATDWIEDIMLRTAGPEVYDQWVNHEIPWTDERVKRAFEIFGEITRDSDRVYGGPTNVLATNFGDSVNALFADSPNAYLHRQASFITSFIKDNNPDLVAGEDFDFFPFPPIDEEHGNPVLGAADMLSMMDNNESARKFMRYMASPGAQMIWVSELGKLGVNEEINPNAYPDNLTKEMAAMLRNADTFRFDGSDSMPSSLGSGAFWQQSLNYVRGQDLDNILQRLEDAAEEAY